MVEIGRIYSFSAREIECIEASNTGGRFRLTVHTKSGKSYSVDYSTEAARNLAQAAAVRQHERDVTEMEQKILNRLYLIQGTVERTDKRQLRIWRQLKALLGTEVEEE